MTLPVLGLAKILGLLEQDTLGETLITAAILVGLLPFASAALTSACRRAADRLVE